MGVLTDIVMADPNDAQRVLDSDVPSREFGIDVKGIDPVKLGTLYAVLTGTKYDPGFIGEPVAASGDMGPWVMVVPGDLVKRLADLHSDRLVAIGAEWAKTEEFQPKYDNWSKQEVTDVLVEIARLCADATAAGKCVFMWMCL